MHLAMSWAAAPLRDYIQPDACSCIVSLLDMSAVDVARICTTLAHVEEREEAAASLQQASMASGHFGTYEPADDRNQSLL